MTSHTMLPSDALAANWDPDVLREYMAGVQREREQGIEEDDDPMPSDSSDDDDFDGEDSSYDADMPDISTTSINDDLRADDIAPDDDAFSSDDEFTDPSVRSRQQIRRELVLGRPAPELLRYTHKQLIDLREGYITQLDEADAELEEMTGVPKEVIERRHSADETKNVIDKNDLEGALRELRTRSKRQVFDGDRQECLEEIVFLAQAVFRKERVIKSMMA